MRRMQRPSLLAFAFAFAVLLWCGFARAHQVGLSRGDYRWEAAALSVELTFARREVIDLVKGLDGDADGLLSPAEVEHAQKDLLGPAIIPRVEVSAGGAACAGAFVSAALVEEDGLALRAVYRCAEAKGPLRVDLALLSDLPYGHRHIAKVTAGGAASESVVFAGRRAFDIALPEQPSNAAPKAGAEESSFFGFFWMGIEHILFGYDHLVFLFGLVLVGGRLRAILLVVTAFTVAHSITLALAVLGVLAPGGRLIEPAIALSVAYVGAENLFVKDADKRWRITFPFGLVHGFGFAGALGEIALPRPEIPLALFSFNLGVEAGQLAALSVVLPIILVARKKKWFAEKGVKIASIGIIALGLVWFVLRVAY
jgi:hydrogenase/urease accessory protein HupE